MLVVAGCGDKKEDEPVVKKEVAEKDTEEKEEPAASEPDEIDEKYAEEALAVLEENNEYANAQDLDGYLKAVPDDMKEQNREVIAEMFAQGTFEFEMVDYQFESANEDEVVISVLQTTTAIDEIEGFQDNISEIQHTMRPENGEWKIFESNIINSEPYGDEVEASGEINEESAEAALEVLYENTEYANAQDVDGYLKAFSKEDQDVARESVEQLFSAGEIEYEILDYEVVFADEDSAEIVVLQTTVGIDDIEGLEDNISEVAHTFVLEDDEWKITESEVLDSEPFEE